MEWTQAKVSKLIESRPNYQSFLKRECKCLDVNLNGIDVLFLAEDEGIGAFLRFPYMSDTQHEQVISFLRSAIPIISQRIEKLRDKDLGSKYCIPKQEPR